MIAGRDLGAIVCALSLAGCVVRPLRLDDGRYYDRQEYRGEYRGEYRQERSHHGYGGHGYGRYSHEHEHDRYCRH